MKLLSFARTLSLPLLILLAGCSSHSTLPDFTASGYLADRGVVRIWRKNHQQQVAHLMTVYTPFNGAATETTDYLWQKDKLLSIERHITGDKPDDVTLRFDQSGDLSFMQRQLAGRREALSADEIALYQFDAQRMLKISDDLLSGSVLLRQGRWRQDGTVSTCQGTTVHPDMEATELRQITRQQQEASAPVSIAWLEAPGGTQLLLVSNSDLCKNEPKEDDF